MYQAEYKLEYLKEKSEMIQKQYSLFFLKVLPYEELHNKSIHEFSLDQIEETLKQISPLNIKQAKVYCSMINGYRRFKYKDNDNIFSNVGGDFYYNLTAR